MQFLIMETPGPWQRASILFRRMASTRGLPTERLQVNANRRSGNPVAEISRKRCAGTQTSRSVRSRRGLQAEASVGSPTLTRRTRRSVQVLARPDPRPCCRPVSDPPVADGKIGPLPGSRERPCDNDTIPASRFCLKRIRSEPKRSGTRSLSSAARPQS